MQIQQTNNVELIGTYGGDITHALSAWTSTTRELDDEKRERIGKLLIRLADNGHETPFEKSTLHFLVTTDIATHIHLLKHRIGVSINAESARYKRLNDKLYVPFDWTYDEQQMYINFMQQAYDAYHRQLEILIERGVSKERAKESARFYLPYGNQIVTDITFNWRSFMHFLRLRYNTHAQAEVRLLATQMLEIVHTQTNGDFQLTMQAFKLLNDDNHIRDPFD